MFTPTQINNLLEVLRKQNLFFISSKLGPDYLSQDEIRRLQYFGINPFHQYSNKTDIVLQMFHFGMISDAIGELDAKKTKYNDLIQYFESGDYIPLTKTQKSTLDSIKRQFLGDIKANEGRVFQDVNNIIAKEEKKNRLAYEKVIRDEILSGTLKRKTSKQIAQELAKKTGDWSRNFNRIVEYVSHQAFDEGRAAMIEDKYGDDTKVYKNVFDGACKHCIKAYLTAGIGSKPIIFKLSTLKANGSNIGRKVDEYKPVIGNHHPHCFDDQTEVLTNEGWKYFKNLNKTELFLSVNLQTGEGEWCKAVNWINELYEGPMYYFKNKNNDLATTPNHHHVIKTIRNQKLRLIETKNLPINSHFLKHLPKWTGIVPEFIFDNTFYDPKLFMQFLGFFLSEGSVIRYKKRLTLHIAQSEKKYLDEIFILCKKVFGESVSKSKDYIQIMCNLRPELWKWCKSLGDRSNKKRIPYQVKNSTIELINEFLITFCKGDGSFVKGRKWDNYQCKDSRLFYTSSKYLSDDLGELILKIGKTPSYKFREPMIIYDPKRKKNYMQNQGIWIINETTNKFGILSAMNQQIKQYRGFIYDVELEKNHTLFVRRNGKVIVSGNCRCTLHKLDPIYDWNTKTRSFDIPKKNAKDLVKKINRKPIRVKFNNKEYFV